MARKEVLIVVTQRVADYVRNKGISTAKISEMTGVGYQILCNCFDKNKSRQLKADELLLVCRYLEVNPYDFMDFEKKSA